MGEGFFLHHLFFFHDRERHGLSIRRTFNSFRMSTSFELEDEASPAAAAAPSNEA